MLMKELYKNVSLKKDYKRFYVLKVNYFRELR